MKNLKVIVFCIGMSLCFVYVASAGAAGIGERKVAPEVLEKGRAVYSDKCARCHGNDGMGRTKIGEMVEAPNLTDAKWQAERSDNRMIGSIQRGRGQMPAFGKKLSKEETAAVVAYVRSLKK